MMEALRERVEAYTPPDGTVEVICLGQNGFLFRYAETSLVIDPHLSDCVSACNPGNPQWVRRYAPPLTPAACGSLVQYVLVTHDHIDHADPDTLLPMFAAYPHLVCIAPAPSVSSISQTCGISGARILAAHVGEPIVCGDITVTPVPAAHEELEYDAQGDSLSLGYLLRCGDLTMYHAGDCCIFDGIEDGIRGADIAFLPINGRDTYRRRQDLIGNMDAEEAIRLAQLAEVGMLVPMHHDLYAANGADAASFVAALERISPQQRFHIFRPGERLLFD